MKTMLLRPQLIAALCAVLLLSGCYYYDGGGYYGGGYAYYGGGYGYAPRHHHGWRDGGWSYGGGYGHRRW